MTTHKPLTAEEIIRDGMAASPRAQGQLFCDFMSALTSCKLHNKADIAQVMAHMAAMLQPPTDAPCGCSLTTRLTGDGCRICNPQFALEVADERITDLEAELAALKAGPTGAEVREAADRLQRCFLDAGPAQPWDADIRTLPCYIHAQQPRLAEPLDSIIGRILNTPRIPCDPPVPGWYISLHNDATDLAEEVLRAHQGPGLTGGPHPDDLAVDRFAVRMKEKLAQKRAEGRGGWENPEQCSVEFLVSLLHGHVTKGDPVDIGNIAMMLWNRGVRGNRAAFPAVFGKEG